MCIVNRGASNNFFCQCPIRESCLQVLIATDVMTMQSSTLSELMLPSQQLRTYGNLTFQSALFVFVFIMNFQIFIFCLLIDRYSFFYGVMLKPICFKQATCGFNKLSFVFLEQTRNYLFLALLILILCGL